MRCGWGCRFPEQGECTGEQEQVTQASREGFKVPRVHRVRFWRRCRALFISSRFQRWHPQGEQLRDCIPHRAPGPRPLLIVRGLELDKERNTVELRRGGSQKEAQACGTPSEPCAGKGRKPAWSQTRGEGNPCKDPNLHGLAQAHTPPPLCNSSALSCASL